MKNDKLQSSERKERMNSHDIADIQMKTELKPISPILLTQLRNGDHAAFQSVYLQCADSTRPLVTTLLRSSYEAEELTQEVFVQLWEKRENIDPQSNFRAYLGMITKWAAFNLIDHKKVEHKYRDFVTYIAQDLSPAPDQMVLTEELALMIRISLDRMPQKQRRVFELSRFEGKTNAEIAKLLNISDSTVRVHLHTAMNQLKEIITLFFMLFVGR